MHCGGLKCVMVISFLPALISCRKPYNPPATSSPNSYLVVEGVINAGSDSTVIKLSRTVKISNAVTVNPETGDVVTVESDQNYNYSLQETHPGLYVCPGLNLDNTHKYRLRIKAANNAQYLSDFVPVLISPPIDSVTFAIEKSGINVYSSTHDPSNIINYYRWEYQETWMFHSVFQSFYKSNGDTVLLRDMVNDDIYTCWKNDTSSTVVINSSAKLSKSVISNNLITAVDSGSEKLSVEYSILVRQYALTADAYSFWTNLKKNTEQLGSIFDAQPSQLIGNIHSSNNPAEPVIGYISVGSTSSTRLFVRKRQLPFWRTRAVYPDCYSSIYLYIFKDPKYGNVYNQVNQYINYNSPQFESHLYIPYGAVQQPGHPPTGYYAAEPKCVDCTLRGTNRTPNFWIF